MNALMNALISLNDNESLIAKMSGRCGRAKRNEEKGKISSRINDILIRYTKYGNI
jgi:hypothetical protein